MTTFLVSLTVASALTVPVRLLPGRHGAAGGTIAANAFCGFADDVRRLPYQLRGS